MRRSRIFTILLLVFLMLTGIKTYANIFASLVEVEFDGNFPATISYTLNETATSVVITIKQDDVLVKTINIGIDEEGTFLGPNYVTWDGSLDNSGTAGNGIYTIEITVTDDIGHDTWGLISLDVGPDNWFWSSASVATNRRQTSPYFGMLYVCERSGGTSGNQGAIYTERGVYLFNSFASYWGVQQVDSYPDGNFVVSWIPFGGESPVGVYVGPDDAIYLTVLGTSGEKGGVVSGDGLYSASSVGQVLDLLDLSNHGPVSRCAVVGTGSSRMLYTCEQLGESTDFDPQTLDPNTVSVLRRYHLGDSDGPFSGVPEQVLGDVLTRPFDVDFDSRGYMYVIQNETSENAVANDTWGLSKWDISVDPPQEIWHVPTDSLPPDDYVPIGLLPRTVGFSGEIDSPTAPAANFVGIDIDEPRDRLYVARRGKDANEAGGPIYQILQFSMETGEFKDGLDTSVEMYFVNGELQIFDLGTASSRGYNQRDVAVDAAGNVISVNSNTEALRVYSPPDGPNSFLTHSPWAVQVGSGEPVIPTPVDFSIDVAENDATPAALSYQLLQNYPNPFNPETKLSFQLPKREYVEVRIFNALGQLIRKLGSRNYEAGVHAIVWDSRDDSGHEVVSGVYLYNIVAGSFSETRKMALIR